MAFGARFKGKSLTDQRLTRVKNILDLSDKTILVTGAASGIGREAAITISRLGAKIILLDISAEGLQDTLHSLEGEGHIIKVTDLTDFEFLKILVNEVVEKCGKLNGVVHCAGISSRKPLNVLSYDGFGKVMDINFYSFVELVKNATKKKYFEDGGSIVVMSSISSIRGYKAKAEYCVSKAAVDAFVRCMALELAERKIRVNSIMPGAVITPMAIKAQTLNNQLGTDSFEAPLGNTEPYEVANMIVFLLSNATKTITGTSILMDGGACI